MEIIYGLISKYLEDNCDDFGKMEELSHCINNFFVDKSEEYPELHECFVCRFNEFTDEVSTDDIVLATCLLRKQDGSVGCKWTKIDTDQVAKQYNVFKHIKNCNMYHWYFVLNYVYAKFYGADKTMPHYVEHAIAELQDQSICLKTKVCAIIERFNTDDEDDEEIDS